MSALLCRPVTVRLDGALYSALRAEARSHRLSISDVVRLRLEGCGIEVRRDGQPMAEAP